MGLNRITHTSEVLAETQIIMADEVIALYINIIAISAMTENVLPVRKSYLFKNSAIFPTKMVVISFRVLTIPHGNSILLFSPPNIISKSNFKKCNNFKKERNNFLF